MLETELVTIQDKTKYILEHYPETRDNRKKFASTYMLHYNTFKVKELGEALLESESALRAQRTIQNTWGLYPPTIKVEKQRDKASKAHAFVNSF